MFQHSSKLVLGRHDDQVPCIQHQWKLLEAASADRNVCHVLVSEVQLCQAC